MRARASRDDNDPIDILHEHLWLIAPGPVIPTYLVMSTDLGQGPCLVASRSRRQNTRGPGAREPAFCLPRRANRPYARPKFRGAVFGNVWHFFRLPAFVEVNFEKPPISLNNQPHIAPSRPLFRSDFSTLIA
jgi:hypothetical protein